MNEAPKMKQVDPSAAQLGDMAVCSLPAEGIAGSVCGVSVHDEGSVTVRWDDSTIDVYGMQSPSWGFVSLYRDEGCDPEAANCERGRHTFTVPDGYEAVRDAEGRATGELRQVVPAFKPPWQS